jgi:hypothetical protein
MRLSVHSPSPPIFRRYLHRHYALARFGAQGFCSQKLNLRSGAGPDHLAIGANALEALSTQPAALALSSSRTSRPLSHQPADTAAITPIAIMQAACTKKNANRMAAIGFNCSNVMKCARIISIGLIAAVAFSSSAAAIENTDELAGYCQNLERGAKGAGRHIYIPNTREAVTCWGYMQAIQDLSVLADENGQRIMGACPPEQTTTLQLVRSFVRYARSHHSELPGNAVLAVFRALRETYPCRADHED